MKHTKKISKKEKKLKTRCLRYRKGKCISRYTKKEIKMILALNKEYRESKKNKK